MCGSAPEWVWLFFRTGVAKRADKCGSVTGIYNEIPTKTISRFQTKFFTSVSAYPEISIYCYLLSIEDRETYQCYPSYKTIGKALGMSENTVSKYVRSREEKGSSAPSRRWCGAKTTAPSTET